MSGLKGMQLLAGFTWLALAAVLLVASTALAACGGEQATTAPESQPTATQPPASGGQLGGAQPPTATSAPPGTSEPERNDAATPTDTPQPPPTAAMTSEPSLEPEDTAEKAEEPIATEPPATSPPTLEEPTPPAETAATATPAPDPEAPQNLAHLFALPNALDENTVSLKSFRGQKSVVLIFYRGFW